MLEALAVLFIVPRVLNVGNRVIEEYILPRFSLKTGARGEENVRPIAFDLAITDKELIELDDIGAMDIIAKGIARHNLIKRSGGADVCKVCDRLSM